MSMPESRRRLVELLPPPNEGVAAPLWDETRAEVDLPIPSDYKWFCATYGGGEISKPSATERGAWLEIFSPSRDGHDAVPGGLKGLIGYHMRHFYPEFTYDGADEDMWAGEPQPVYPDPGGVVGWGMTEWGDSLFWLTGDADPDKWPVVAWMRSSGEPVYPECGMVDFLVKVFNGYFPEMTSWNRPGLQWTMKNDWLRTGIAISNGPGRI